MPTPGLHGDSWLGAGTEAGLGLSSSSLLGGAQKAARILRRQVLSRFPGGEEEAPGLPVPHLKTGPMPLRVYWGLDECERVPDPGVLGGSGRGEASCFCSCNTRAQPLCNPLRPQPCAFAHRTVPRDWASHCQGPPASLQPQQLLQIRHLKTLSSLCSSKAGRCDGEVPRRAPSTTSWPLPLLQPGDEWSPLETASYRMRDPHHLRPQIRGRHSHSLKHAFFLSHQF
mgnify:CR=1 FL=1